MTCTPLGRDIVGRVACVICCSPERERERCLCSAWRLDFKLLADYQQLVAGGGRWMECDSEAAGQEWCDATTTHCTMCDAVVVVCVQLEVHQACCSPLQASHHSLDIRAPLALSLPASSEMLTGPVITRGRNRSSSSCSCRVGPIAS